MAKQQARKKHAAERTIEEKRTVEKEPAMEKERTMQGTEKLSEAIEQYKASLTSGVKVTGQTSEGDGKVFVVSRSGAGTPICVEFKRGDVLDIQKSGSGETATVSVKKDADYVLTVAGIAGHEDDLPSGLSRIFEEVTGAPRSS